MGNYPNIRLFKTIDDLVAAIVSVVQSNDHVLFMSNGSFSGIHQIIEDRLNS